MREQNRTGHEKEESREERKREKVRAVDTRPEKERAVENKRQESRGHERRESEGNRAGMHKVRIRPPKEFYSALGAG